jgi:hypothetical protein
MLLTRKDFSGPLKFGLSGFHCISLHEVELLTHNGTLALTTQRDPTKSQVEPNCMQKQAMSTWEPQ